MPAFDCDKMVIEILSERAAQLERELESYPHNRPAKLELKKVRATLAMEEWRVEVERREKGESGKSCSGHQVAAAESAKVKGE